MIQRRVVFLKIGEVPVPENPSEMAKKGCWYIFQLNVCNNVNNDSMQPNLDSAADQAGADELDDGAEGSSVDRHDGVKQAEAWLDTW